MNGKAKKLSNQDLTLLERSYEAVSFPHAFQLIYEGHVPNLGVVLLEGQAVLTKKNRVVGSIDPGTVLGINELINNTALNFGCKLYENTKVILLQKSEIFDLLRDKRFSMKQVLQS